MTRYARNFFASRREELGLSLAEMATRVGFTTQAVANWEAYRNAPNPKHVDQLAKAYEVSVEEMSVEIVRIARALAAA